MSQIIVKSDQKIWVQEVWVFFVFTFYDNVESFFQVKKVKCAQHDLYPKDLLFFPIR